MRNKEKQPEPKFDDEPNPLDSKIYTEAIEALRARGKEIIKQKLMELISEREHLNERLSRVRKNILDIMSLDPLKVGQDESTNKAWIEKHILD